MAERALALAVEAEDEQLEYRARLWTADFAYAAGDIDALAINFDWCRFMNASDPDAFGAGVEDGPQLVTHYLRSIRLVDASPDFSLELADSLLEDLADHCRHEGLNPAIHHWEAFHHAWATGQLESALKLHSELSAAPASQLPCGLERFRYDSVAFLFDVEAESAALALLEAAPPGADGTACGRAKAIARSLAPLWRSGHWERAMSLHRGGYPAVCHDLRHLEAVADHLAFCAIADTPHRAVELAERHLEWVSPDSPNRAAQLRLLAALSLALTTASRAGLGDRPLLPPTNAHPADHPKWEANGTPPTASATVPGLLRATADLATAFDRRNRNSHASGQVARLFAMLDNPHTIPALYVGPPASPPADARRLRLGPARGDNGAPPLGAAAQISDTALQPAQDASPRSAPPAAPAGATPNVAPNPPTASQADAPNPVPAASADNGARPHRGSSALAAPSPGGSASPLSELRAPSNPGAPLPGDSRWQAAVAALDRAMTILEDEARLPAGRLADAVAVLNQAMALLETAAWETQPDLRSYGLAVLESRSLANHSLGDLSAAARDLDRALRLVREDGDHAFAAHLLEVKAEVLSDMGDWLQATAQFFKASDFYRRAGSDLDAGWADVFGAQLLAERLDRPAEATVILAAVLEAAASLPAGNDRDELTADAQAALSLLAAPNLTGPIDLIA
jgi:tetratricopeptide (TPR) repeat protein